MRNLLLKNNGDKTFTEIAIPAGVSESACTTPEGAQAVDFDLDGNIDLYAGCSFFKNLGDFKFVDIAKDLGLPGLFDEGVKFYDWDLDGDFDLLINYPNHGPYLYQNNSNNSFEVVRNIYPNDHLDFWDSSYGVNTGDINNDGHDDILIGGGYAKDGSRQAPILWVYNDGLYEKKEAIKNTGKWSAMTTFGDFDSNGSLDLGISYGGSSILLNNDIPKKYIKLLVVENDIRNQQGRVVKVFYPNRKIKAMVIDGGSGYMASQPYKLLIPNNQSEFLRFEINCKDKILSFTAVEGFYKADCATSEIGADLQMLGL